MRRTAFIVFAVVVALAALGYGAYAWYTSRIFVTTDDAYVEGNVSVVSAKVSGHVVELLVDDNQPVHKGDLLVRIDPRDYRTKLDQARAAVAMAESRVRAATERVAVDRETAAGQVAQAHASSLSAKSAERSAHEQLASNRAIVASRVAALGAARAELERAKAADEHARQDLDRIRKLLEQELVAQRDYDQAVTDAKASDAAVRAARDRVTQAERDLASAEADVRVREAGYETTGIGLGMANARLADARAKKIQAEAMQQEVRVRQAERELALAELREAQATAAFAELQLGYTDVRAALAGVIAKRTVEIGQFVQPGQPMMAIVPLADVWVVANFKETQLARLRPGMRADITVDSYPGRTYTGVVDSISAGTGARFSLLPPENATGNWVKVVQRIPVKIRLDRPNTSNPHPLRAGMSVAVTIRARP